VLEVINRDLGEKIGSLIHDLDYTIHQIHEKQGLIEVQTSGGMEGGTNYLFIPSEKRSLLEELNQEVA